MAADHFREHAAEVRGDGEVAAVVALLAGQAGPAAVDLAAADVLAADVWCEPSSAISPAT